MAFWALRWGMALWTGTLCLGGVLSPTFDVAANAYALGSLLALAGLRSLFSQRERGADEVESKTYRGNAESFPITTYKSPPVNNNFQKNTIIYLFDDAKSAPYVPKYFLDMSNLSA